LKIDIRSIILFVSLTMDGFGDAGAHRRKPYLLALSGAEAGAGAATGAGAVLVRWLGLHELRSGYAHSFTLHIHFIAGFKNKNSAAPANTINATRIFHIVISLNCRFAKPSNLPRCFAA
jgi:hypothetical protein